jgi:hypothetical protein
VFHGGDFSICRLALKKNTLWIKPRQAKNGAIFKGMAGASLAALAI